MHHSYFSDVHVLSVFHQVIGEIISEKKEELGEKWEETKEGIADQWEVTKVKANGALARFKSLFDKS